MHLSTERSIRIFAGAVIMISLALGYTYSPYWYWLTAFAGLNLFQSGFTGFCPPETLLRKCGARYAGGASRGSGS